MHEIINGFRAPLLLKTFQNRFFQVVQMESSGVKSCFQQASGKTPRRSLRVAQPKAPRESNWTLDPNESKKRPSSPLLSRPPKEEIEGTRTALTRFGPRNQRIVPDPYPDMNHAPRTMSRFHVDEKSPQRDLNQGKHPYYSTSAGGVVISSRVGYSHTLQKYVREEKVVQNVSDRFGSCNQQQQARTPTRGADNNIFDRRAQGSASPGTSNGDRGYVGGNLHRAGVLDVQDIAGASPKVWAKAPRNKPDRMNDVHDIAGASPKVYPRPVGSATSPAAARISGDVVAGARPKTATFGKRRSGPTATTIPDWW